MTTKYDALETLNNAATMGNWEAWELRPGDPSWGACEIWADEKVIATMVCGVPNATYIAAAANAVPTLIADVKALAEALKALDEAYCRSGADLTRDERNEDRQRLNAARAALARIQGEAG